MRSSPFNESDFEGAMKPSAGGRRLRRRWQIVGAVIGLGGTVIAVLSGGLLSISAWLVTDQAMRHWLSTAGSVLLLLTIPLVILAAFCLDWADTQHGPNRGHIAPSEDDLEE